MPTTLKLLNWNIEWKRRGTAAGDAIHAHITKLNPDIIILTEAEHDFLALGGYQITADSDYGYGGKNPKRRKVLLWSRWPISEVDTVGNPIMPSGRFIAGTVASPLGNIRAIGVCVPWQRAHVSTGQRNREPWQDHLIFLEGLHNYVSKRDATIPHLYGGDFNQRIPKARQPEAAYTKLRDCLEPLTLCSSGLLPGLEIPSVQHVACTNQLRCIDSFGYELKVDGKPVSDHPAQLFIFAEPKL